MAGPLVGGLCGAATVGQHGGTDGDGGGKAADVAYMPHQMISLGGVRWRHRLPVVGQIPVAQVRTPPVSSCLVRKGNVHHYCHTGNIRYSLSVVTVGIPFVGARSD